MAKKKESQPWLAIKSTPYTNPYKDMETESNVLPKYTPPKNNRKRTRGRNLQYIKNKGFKSATFIHHQK